MHPVPRLVICSGNKRKNLGQSALFYHAIGLPCFFLFLHCNWIVITFSMTSYPYGNVTAGNISVFPELV
ncbi:hypothetical protein, partial [Bacillus pseudomycoides]